MFYYARHLSRRLFGRRRNSFRGCYGFQHERNASCASGRSDAEATFARNKKLTDNLATTLDDVSSATQVVAKHQCTADRSLMIRRSHRINRHGKVGFDPRLYNSGARTVMVQRLERDVVTRLPRKVLVLGREMPLAQSTHLNPPHGVLYDRFVRTHAPNHQWVIS